MKLLASLVTLFGLVHLTLAFHNLKVSVIDTKRDKITVSGKAPRGTGLCSADGLGLLKTFGPYSLLPGPFSIDLELEGLVGPATNGLFIFDGDFPDGAPGTPTLPYVTYPGDKALTISATLLSSGEVELSYTGNKIFDDHYEIGVNEDDGSFVTKYNLAQLKPDAVKGTFSVVVPAEYTSNPGYPIWFAIQGFTKDGLKSSKWWSNDAERQ